MDVVVEDRRAVVVEGPAHFRHAEETDREAEDGVGAVDGEDLGADQIDARGKRLELRQLRWIGGKRGGGEQQERDERSFHAPSVLTTRRPQVLTTPANCEDLVRTVHPSSLIVHPSLVRFTFVVTLLVVALMVTTFIAFRAQMESTYHRATAERVVTDW